MVTWKDKHDIGYVHKITVWVLFHLAKQRHCHKPDILVPKHQFRYDKHNKLVLKYRLTLDFLGLMSKSIKSWLIVPAMVFEMQFTSFKSSFLV